MKKPLMLLCVTLACVTVPGAGAAPPPAFEDGGGQGYVCWYIASLDRLWCVPR